METCTNKFCVEAKKCAEIIEKFTLKMRKAVEADSRKWEEYMAKIRVQNRLRNRRKRARKRAQ